MAQEAVELLRGVPLFADLERRELESLASSLKERTYAAGDTIAREGQAGIGFFIIAEGQAKVTQHDRELATLGPGDHFGEIALIDDGARRSATVTAETDMRCFGLTSWEFRPVVETNAAVAWKLLQTMAKRLRDAEHRA